MRDTPFLPFLEPTPPERPIRFPALGTIAGMLLLAIAATGYPVIAARISAHELRAAATSVGPVAICQHASGKWVCTAAKMAKGPAQFPAIEAPS